MNTRTHLPAHFQVPFLGLLLLLFVAVYELLLPGDRMLWLLVAAATFAGTALKPSAAAVLGWVLVLVLAAYLTVNSAFNPVSGASWLTLLLIPWLPPFASNVVDYVRQSVRQLDRQRTLLHSSANLHPATNLPGMAIAAELVPSINAHIRRQFHQSVLLDVHIANLDVLRTLCTPEELADVQRGVSAALRHSLRDSDWLFQTTDEHLMVVADIGERAEGAVPAEVQQLYGDIKQTLSHLLAGSEQLRRAASGNGPGGRATSGQQVLLDKLRASLAGLPQVELEIRALLLPETLPDFQTLLMQLRQQPLYHTLNEAYAD